ncbi:hypothetical protein COCON_G00224430 [Conger conger]|uniref:Uncharacterized protein n=1 Tax=Conger conger TaxID=82655 RepID=A0A9Q1CWI1_CONCO|nr:hypothetical protein COCON_G00224430 [Conger conger]
MSRSLSARKHPTSNGAFYSSLAFPSDENPLTVNNPLYEDGGPDSPESLGASGRPRALTGFRSPQPQGLRREGGRAGRAWSLPAPLHRRWVYEALSRQLVAEPADWEMQLLKAELRGSKDDLDRAWGPWGWGAEPKLTVREQARQFELQALLDRMPRSGRESKNSLLSPNCTGDTWDLADHMLWAPESHGSLRCSPVGRDIPPCIAMVAQSDLTPPPVPRPTPPVLRKFSSCISSYVTVEPCETRAASRRCDYLRLSETSFAGDNLVLRRGYGRHEQHQQLLRPSLLRPEELSMESGIDPGQEYYAQDYYNYDQGYDLPQYGSRRKLISPMYDEYGEVRGRGRGRRPMRGGPPRRVGFRDLPPEDEIEAEPEEAAAAETGSSKAAKRLKSVMKLSKLLVSSKGAEPPADAPTPSSPWKKAKLFPMMFKGKKDKDYAKLMSARRVDSQDSLAGLPSTAEGVVSEKPSAKKQLGKMLKRINISKKLQVRRESQGSLRSSAAGSEKDEVSSRGTSEEEERKSKVSISVTGESEPEASGSDVERARRARDQSGDESAASGEDKDYLKVDLDRDDALESTVDSDEEQEEPVDDSDEESKSKSEKDDDRRSSEQSGGEASGSEAGSSVGRSGSEAEASGSEVSGSEDGGSVRSSASSRRSTGGSSQSGSERSAASSRSTGGSHRSRKSILSGGSEDTIDEESEQEASDEAESKPSEDESSTGAQSRRSSISTIKSGGSVGPHVGTPYGSEESSSAVESSDDFHGLSPITEVDEDAITSGKTSVASEDSGHSEPSYGRNKRIKLVVDREHETSSTGEDSAPESQRNRLSNLSSHSNVNGTVYLAQNGSIIRTRRPGHSNNLKVCSPARLGKHFKKLDKLAVTQEERFPLGGHVATGISSATDENLNLNLNLNLNARPSSSSLASSTTGPDTAVPKSNSKARGRGADEQESALNGEEVKEPLESHSEHTQSDDEELWMGPWNNLHIPMTKL